MKKLWMLFCFSRGSKFKIGLKMKLLTFLMFTVLAVSAADSYSQAAKFSLKLKDATVREVFDHIEDNSEFILLYNEKWVDVNRRVDINVKNETVEKILDQTFKGTRNVYKIYERQVVILEDEKAEIPANVQRQIVEAQTQQPQQKEITGKVTDSDGLPLPGVSVIVKGTTIGTVTNADGEFSLNIPLNAEILQFSFVGMRTQEIHIEGRTTITVVMEEDVLGIEEVVAVGYGTQKKANLTGAVGVATAERLENRPIVSAGQGLQGVIPNLNISIQDGDPTTTANFNIRGFESINGGSPLILVDGVPMDIERINPNDIASVSVLKDASASAVYGARAAFGVVLVETKRAKKGKIVVTLGTELSLAKPIWLMDLVTDPYQFVLAKNEASMRTNGAPAYDELYVEGTKRWSENPTDENAWAVVDGEIRYYGNSNYADEIITEFAPQNKYDLNISGASEKASYYVSFGFLNKDGYIKNKEKNQNFKRYNILIKTEFQLTDWLSIDEKITFNSQVSDKPHSYLRGVNQNTVARQTPLDMIRFPDLPYYIEPGDREEYEQYIGMYFGGTNWLPYLEDGGRETFTTNDTWFTQGLTLTPIEGFRVRSDFSYRSYWRDYQDVANKVEMIQGNSLNPVTITNEHSGEDFIDNRFNRSQYYVFNAYADYEINHLSGHYFKAMAGFNQEWGRNNFVRAQASNLITPSIWDLNATSGVQQTYGSKNHVFLRGAFYRFNYIFKDKYLLELNGRYDGTSRFPKESRFGFFPSFSAGWRLSHEAFMDGTRNWLDNFKIRASYGELGNQLLGNNYYPYINSMGSGMSPFMMTSGSRTPYVSASGLVSPTLTWETVATQNLGVDITTLNQRLDLSFDAYIRDTKDMLMNVTYPAVLGTGAPQQNAADLRTRGWELSISWRDRIGQDWKYGMNLALSDNQAEITKYENPTGNFNDYYVGKKIGEIWGFQTVGIFQYEEDVASAADQSQIGSNWRPGDIQYADLNNDGKITRGSQTLDDPGDLTIIGNTTARYSFGISPDISYKNWSLNVFFQGLFRDYFPPPGNWAAFYPFNTNIVEKYYLTETWSEDNRDAYFPAPHLSTNDNKNKQTQSRFVQNAAYIRMKNLTLNYNLPTNLINKIKLSRAQVYFSGMNLWEYTKMHKPLDPENVYTTDQEYYFQRIFTLGIKITY
jgi:TonB-linked SusC/RagA family outer membrane protein